jgi:hypothetical protein
MHKRTLGKECRQDEASLGGGRTVRRMRGKEEQTGGIAGGQEVI